MRTSQKLFVGNSQKIAKIRWLPINVNLAFSRYHVKSKVRVFLLPSVSPAPSDEWRPARRAPQSGEAEANPNLINHNELTLLQLLVFRNAYSDCTYSFAKPFSSKPNLDYDATCDVLCKYGARPVDLPTAVIVGNVTPIEKALKDGADINMGYGDDELRNRTLLLIVAEWGKVEIVKFLIEKGADINKPEICWQPPH